MKFSRGGLLSLLYCPGLIFLSGFVAEDFIVSPDDFGDIGGVGLVVLVA